MDNNEDIPQSPRLKEARHIALQLLKTLHITTPPVELNTVCRHLRKSMPLKIHGTTQLSDKIDAVTRREGDDIYILYNESTSVVRQRFSVAHELGHLQLGHLHGNSSIDLGSENFDEIEANQFAAQLLMPATMLRKDIKSGIKDPKILATRYRVSEEALWWQVNKSRLLNLL